MNRLRILALAAVLPLAACGEKPAPAPAGSGASQPTTFIGSKVQQAMDKAKAELETKNINIGSGGVDINVNGRKIKRDSNLPKAEITPQGELLIEGAKVATTPEQQALLKQYRGELIEVAKAGMDIGAQGADLGIKAAGEALKGLFNGDDDKAIEKRIEAEAEGIKAGAKQLCGRLPALLASQQKLAAALPEFQPYATMNQGDIDDCADDIDGHGAAAMSDEERAELRQDIRQGIRDGIREATQAVAGKDEPPAPPAPPAAPAPPAPVARQ
ncbi:hypothetical protein GCM10027084_15880 [Pseudoxanthomonas sangjuensis]|uniref:hypothetical protein n=1 Tax=Pseudoxanthomonas sangjuensis TaxID=1503750 RepID=UPI0031B57823